MNGVDVAIDVALIMGDGTMCHGDIFPHCCCACTEYSDAKINKCLFIKDVCTFYHVSPREFIVKFRKVATLRAI